MRQSLIAIASVLFVVSASAQRPSIDGAFKAFWDAPNPNAAAARADAVVKSGVGFDDAFARLKRGRTYSSEVARGVVRLSHVLNATTFNYAVEVPAGYVPARPYQVRFQLHGGVGRPEPRGQMSIGTLAGAEQIYVLPTSWDPEPWWRQSQVDNLRIILDRLKRAYNVDENRVVVSGVSDGGTGAYYLAMRDTTPFASFLPLNGFMMILANPSLGIREQLHPNNLRNKPFFIVNGGRDPLYPTEVVEPYVKHLERAGVVVTYEPQPDAVHNTAWWPEVKDSFERFVREHPRAPHPATLTWQAEGPDRAHWLVIDKLSAPRAEEQLPDVNDFIVGESSNFGVRSAGMRVMAVIKGSNAETLGFLPGDLVESINGRMLPEGVPLVDILETYDAGAAMTFNVKRDGKPVVLTGAFQPRRIVNVAPLFPQRRPAGRVDLVRDGNTVRATTRGVAAFTLLISPDAFDLTKPIVVVADGRTVFDGRVQKDLATLLKWAARDNDRTMLYAAEIQIQM
jgi:poly(3-hydroxybutyrate) depolymerase